MEYELVETRAALDGIKYRSYGIRMASAFWRMCAVICKTCSGWYNSAMNLNWTQTSCWMLY
jgi:hypothetical protein